MNVHGVCRVHIEADRSLKIERVRLSDAGVYMCHAENAVTFVEASAKLTVHCMFITLRYVLLNSQVSRLIKPLPNHDQTLSGEFEPFRSTVVARWRCSARQL